VNKVLIFCVNEVYPWGIALEYHFSHFDIQIASKDKGHWFVTIFCFANHCVFWTWNCRWVYFDLCAQFHVCDFVSVDSVGCQFGCHLPLLCEKGKCGAFTFTRINIFAKLYIPMHSLEFFRSIYTFIQLIYFWRFYDLGSRYKLQLVMCIPAVNFLKTWHTRISGCFSLYSIVYEKTIENIQPST
jgi:hypothetical protein